MIPTDPAHAARTAVHRRAAGRRIAPLEPGLVVAGAGSGKTSVMAARVVWLVATEQVAPDRVLGLTFTNKAAAELAERVRDALSRAGVAGHDDAGEPVVSTYHAFAGRLVSEHGLRIGVEPRSRLLADATRYQLAGRVLRRHRGPVVHLTRPLSMLIGDLVSLESDLSEHLVSPAELVAWDADWLAELTADLRGVRRAEGHQDALRRPAEDGRRRPSTDRARRHGRGLPRREARPRRDRLRRPGGARRPARRDGARGRCRRAGAGRCRAARRIPGHQRRAATDADGAVRRRASGDGGRRPVPGDLRLARRVGRQPRRLPPTSQRRPASRHRPTPSRSTSAPAAGCSGSPTRWPRRCGSGTPSSS